MGRKEDKKKKEKIVYVDDGSTISDMSGTGGKPKSKKTEQSKSNSTIRPRATFKEQWKTYTDAVKMMILPMFVVLGIIALAYLIVYIIL